MKIDEGKWKGTFRKEYTRTNKRLRMIKEIKEKEIRVERLNEMFKYLLGYRQALADMLECVESEVLETNKNVIQMQIDCVITRLKKEDKR